MATRITATAAAIGLAGAALALQPARAARADAGVPAASGGSVPFSVADPATAPRPVVTVEIGGVPLLLLLDTGSTGIRISADKVPAKAVTITGAAAPYGYGSGVRLHGDKADTDVTIGGYHTGSLPIELVRSTDCFPDKPDCPAAHGAKPAMFGGVLDGVMGVSLETAAGLVNPMWTLRDQAGAYVGRQFAVQFAPDQFSGNILLGVPPTGYGLVQLPTSPVLKAKRVTAVPQAGDARTAAERYASYHSYAARPLERAMLGGGIRQRQTALPAAPAPVAAADPATDTPTSWNPRAVRTCLAGVGLPKSCAPAMFDSGTPNFVLDVPGATPGTWPAGRALQAGVPQVGWNQTFTSGPGTGVIVTDSASSDTGGSLLGLPAFARGPIRFDLVAGTVGFPSPGASSPAPAGRSLLQAAPVPAVAPPP
ncbi:MAG: hypothetical protein HOW97_09955, partial [Catenulispora sp.]|nr:hypothetical protein [Catenulispora sp.]